MTLVGIVVVVLLIIGMAYLKSLPEICPRCGGRTMHEVASRRWCARCEYMEKGARRRIDD